MRSGFANVFIYVMCSFLCLFGTQSYLPFHPIATGYDVANSSTASLRCSVSMTNCKATINLSNRRVCGGMKIRASVHFLLVISNAAREFSRECQFKNAMVLESLESNAKLHHLALPTMLSALKHDWGILALFVVVN